MIDRILPPVMSDDEFASHRSALFGIAYRMLGTVADAEDMVQETFLRWQAQERSAIRTPRAWLTSTVTRLCIDQLRSARRQRGEYYGVWLPEPLVESQAPSPADNAALADSLSMAFLTMLESLSPEERAVFLLREAFDYEYEEIARVVDKSEAACRQIVSRSRQHLAQRKLRFAASPLQAEGVVRQFLAACANGDTRSLLSVLAEDVTLITDGGGRVRAAGRPIHSADHVSRFFVGIRRRVPSHAEYRFTLVNQRPGLVVISDGVVNNVFSFEIDGGHIRTIYLVRNPDKLQRLQRSLGNN